VNDLLQGVRAFDRRHPLWWDVGFAALVAAVSFNAGPNLGPAGLMVWGIVHTTAAFRRRRPLPALIVAASGVVISTALTLLASIPSPWPYLAIWVLLFHVGLRDGRRKAAVVVVGAVVLMATSALLAPPADGVLEPRERISLTVAVLGMCTATFLLGLQIRGRREQLAAQRAQIARAAVVAERSRIAQEMHDIIGHNLSVIASLSAGGAVAARTAPEAAARAFEAIGDVSRSSLREVRRILSVLRHDASADGSPLSPQPGLDALPALLETVRATGITVVQEQTGDLRGLDTGRQLSIYRIVQESLTNVLRHAGPRARATVSIEREPNGVVVTVIDNGRGVQPAVVGHEHGILGMRERAEAYGGSLEAGAIDGGWRVCARIPLEGSEEPR
jgi:signal transduction histidine kinase